MDPALRASASGMMAQQTRTEVIANNLANVNTTGFKRSRAHFEDLLYQTIQGQSVIGSQDSNIIPSVQVGRGVRLAAVQREHEQGIIEPTGRKPDAKQLTISVSGVVTVIKGTDTEPTEVGRLELARFANPSGLESEGQNLFRATAASGQPVTGFPDEEGMGKTRQGSLEGSNVEIVQEMVEMIAAMRAYEINSKAIKQADEMGQIANNMTR